MTSNHGRMLQLRKERTFRKRMPPAQERTSSMEKTIQGCGNHLRGDDRRRTVGKRQPLGISGDNHHPRETPVVKPGEDPPYRVRTARYDREEKIMIKVRIQGTDGNECTTTAFVTTVGHQKTSSIRPMLRPAEYLCNKKQCQDEY